MSIREFEDISIPKRKLTVPGLESKTYRVYKNATEFVTTEADSASEAVAKSGVTKVFKIKRGGMDEVTMLEGSMLSAIAASVEVPVAPVDAPPAV